MLTRRGRGHNMKQRSASGSSERTWATAASHRGGADEGAIESALPATRLPHKAPMPGALLIDLSPCRGRTRVPALFRTLGSFAAPDPRGESRDCRCNRVAVVPRAYAVLSQFQTPRKRLALSRDPC